jgi:DNA-binding CsgD family transcriptional regulator
VLLFDPMGTRSSIVIGSMAVVPMTRIYADEAVALVKQQAARRRGRRSGAESTMFLMDEELVVRGAGGESILRLPWFDDDLFVGRQLPDIVEMPRNVRLLAVTHYRAALAGERGCFSFVSYGHAYSVDAVPVLGPEGGIGAVLGVATPVQHYPAAVTGYERTAERFDQSGAGAKRRAARHRAAGRVAAEREELQRAERAFVGAEQARRHMQRLGVGGAAHDMPPLTPREVDVLVLASHGLTSSKIAEELFVSSVTVETHLKNIYAKLAARNKAAAVAVALRHGLID